MKTKKSKQSRKKIFIVDDHPMMREGLVQLISNEPDLEVCGEGETAASALEKIATCKPGLVLADITLPDKNGLELIKDIQALSPTTPVLVISMRDETLYAERVLRAGGRGYIMKQAGGKKIMEGIRQVLSGQIYVSEKMAGRILEIFSGHRGKASHSPVENLTDREFETFQLVGSGLATKEIAQKMHVSTKTVEAHRMNIKAKLQLKTAAELIRYSVRWLESNTT